MGYQTAEDKQFASNMKSFKKSNEGQLGKFYMKLGLRNGIKPLKELDYHHLYYFGAIHQTP